MNTQLQAVIDTFQNVFSGSTVLFIFGIVAIVALGFMGALLLHVRACSPTPGSMKTLVIIYAGGTCVLLACVFIVGIIIP